MIAGTASRLCREAHGLIRNALFPPLPSRRRLHGHRRWQPAWRDAAPKPAYDVLIIGGGGHGLATAHYLASRYGSPTWPCWKRLYRLRQCRPEHHDHPLELPAARQYPVLRAVHAALEGLEQDLNYNTMVSQRGVLNLYHSDAQRDAYARRGNAMRLAGVDSELLGREAVRSMVPFFDYDNARFPIQGGCCSGAAARRGMMP